MPELHSGSKRVGGLFCTPPLLHIYSLCARLYRHSAIAIVCINKFEYMLEDIQMERTLQIQYFISMSLLVELNKVHIFDNCIK